MKKFTKSFLTLALLFTGVCVQNLQAKELVVDLSAIVVGEGNKTDDNATWDSSTNTFEWTGTWSNAMQLPGIPSNMSDYTTVNWTATAGTMDHFRILIYYSNGTAQTTYNPGTDMTGNKSVTFADMGVSTANLAYISSIKISGANNGTGNIIISAFSFTGPDIVPIEATPVYKAPSGTVNMQDLTGNYALEGPNTWRALTTYPKELASGGTTFGGWDGSNEAEHVDISEYDYLSLVISEAQENSVALRIWIWDDVNNKVVTLYPYPEANYDSVENWETEYRISAPGTYVVKVSDYNHLKGIKAANNNPSSPVTVAYAYLSKGAPVPYQPTGEYIVVGKDNTGSSSLTAALSDNKAVYYDATGLTGTNITLTPTNLNALIKANEGALANDKNVIIGDVCAKLELTDKNPFNAPVAFTATSAKFTKTVENDYATMVIPFAAAVPSDVEAYEITGNNGDKLTTSLVESVAANKPVMLKGNGTFDFVAENAAIAATTNAAQNNGLLNGVYANTAVPTENTYVLQKQVEDVNFYKAISGLTVNPFRAYLTTAVAGAARLTFDFNEATGIKTVKTTEGTEVYNLQGVRVANPTKGLYIVNGKKVIK